MPIMRIRLSFLDKQNFIAYDTAIPVIHINESNTLAGTCKIFLNERNQHCGELILNIDISKELYFYYLSRITNEGIFYIIELELSEQPLKDTPTTSQLKDLIIE